MIIVTVKIEIERRPGNVNSELGKSKIGRHHLVDALGTAQRAEFHGNSEKGAILCC